MRSCKVVAVSLVVLLALGCSNYRKVPGSMAETKILNNFVSELLSITGGQSAKQSEYKFVNPREGWVFISSTADVSGPDRMSIFLSPKSSQDPVIVHDNPGENQILEAMRYLSAGEHTVAISSEGRSKLKSLTVRAIPEIIYNKFPYKPTDAHVFSSDRGPNGWDFLQRHIFPNVNTIIGSDQPDYRLYFEEWKRQGKRWIIWSSVPGRRDKDITADEAYQAFARNNLCVNRFGELLDGVIADEFPEAELEQYPAWTEAVKRYCQDERFKEKLFYTYCGSLYRFDLSSRFIEQAVVGCGNRFVLERYSEIQPTEEAAWEALNRVLGDECLEWERKIPGSVNHMIIALGYFSIPALSLNINPGVNWKVFMDMQFNTLANHPGCQGIYGVMEYTSGYAEEEIIRWQGKLYRHYCIEGKTEMLSKDPYVLTHIANPDFDEGTKGWTLNPAEEGSIEAKHMIGDPEAGISGYGGLQGRWPDLGRGNHFLWTRRSDKRPNIFSQDIKDLQPGKLYSLKMITADYEDLTVKRPPLSQKYAVSIKLDDAEIIKSFQHMYSRKFWLNYHFVIFRPGTRISRLEISDWAESGEPGGPIGQELIYNFIEIQPYLEDGQ